MQLKTGKSEFIKSVLTLMSGTVIAQLIAYLIYPVLTRIYSPNDMGELGVYTRIVAFVAAFATARYESTITITKADHHAFSLFRLSLKIATTVLFALFLVGLIYYFSQAFHLSKVVFLVLTILSAYASVWINLGTNWSIRKKLFREISGQRMVNSISVNVFRLVFGLMNWGAFGLLFGSLLGSALSILAFTRTFVKNKSLFQSSNSSKRIRVLAKEYRVYPIVYLPHVLLDLGVDLLLAALIVRHFGTASFGSYSYAYLMLKLPIGLFGQSVGQVFLQKATELKHHNRSIYSLTLKTAKTLFLISVLPFTVLFFFGSQLFAYVFGENWTEAGTIASILSPALMLNFVISPLSSLSLVLNKQKLMFGVGIIVAVFQLFNLGVLPILFKTLKSIHLLSDELNVLNTILVFNSIFLGLVYIVVLFLFLGYTKKEGVNGTK